jgi:iron(III) transport system substrate-binding protein
MKFRKLVKRLGCIIISLVCVLPLFSGCTVGENTVIIYTSAEYYRVEDMWDRLHQEFPSYDIVIDYQPTGNHAAKLITEKTTTEADITYDLEYGYLTQLQNANVLADLKDLYDFSVYTEDAIDSTYYLPTYKNGGAIIINTKALNERGLEKPTCYQDLLKAQYKNLISMPNPKSSGTGYMFLRSLTNVMGEEQAFTYFDSLTENVLSYTSSGSGPVNALIQEEVVIGLGMTGQAVTAINDGSPLEIIFFEDGSPYSMYGQGIIKGKENRKAVKDVFDFLINTYQKENCQKFFPEQIFKDLTFEIENYPKNINYADMSGNTTEEKTRLLKKWSH